MSNQPDDADDTDDTDAEPDDAVTRSVFVGLAIAVEGGFVLLAWLLGWLVEVPALDRFSFDLAGLGWGLLATPPLLAAFFLASRHPVGPLRSIARFTDETLRPLASTCSLVDLLGISVLAGFAEELFFRGVAQEAFRVGLLEPLGPAGSLAVALGVSACLFGIMHAVTPGYALFAAIMGVYFGLTYHLTGNLFSVMVAHALYDFVALVWLTRDGGGDGPPA